MTKPYATVGRGLLLEIIRGSRFILIDDPDEYIINCKYHGLVGTGFVNVEVIEDMREHMEICNEESDYRWLSLIALSVIKLQNIVELTTMIIDVSIVDA